VRYIYSVFSLTLVVLAGVSPHRASVPHADGLPLLGIEYPPHVTVTRADGGTGYQALLSFLRAKNVDVTFDLQIVPVSRVVRQLYRGQWCVTTFPPKLDETYAFPAPVYLPIEDRAVGATMIRLARPGPFRWDSFAYFAGKRVGWVNSALTNYLADQLRDAGAILVSMNDVDHGLKLLAHGRVDYVAADAEYLDTADLANDTPVEASETLFASYEYGIFINPLCEEAQTLLDFAKKQAKK